MNRRCFSLFLIALASLVAYAQAAAPKANPRQAEAIAFASSWLDLVDRGEDEKSFDQLAPAYQDNLALVTWRDTMGRTRTQLGKRLSRKLRRVVWQEKPADAPLPGLYAFVEFDGAYENAGKHFQYVLLYSRDGAPFKVMRNEATFALNRTSNSAKAAASKFSSPYAEAAAIWSQIKDKPEYRRYQQEFVQYNNSLQVDARSNCHQAGTEPIDLLLVISHNGSAQFARIQRVFANSQSDKAQCFVRSYEGLQTKAPPFVPFVLQLSKQ